LAVLALLAGLAVLAGFAALGGCSRAGARPALYLCISHLNNAFNVAVARYLEEEAGKAGAGLVVQDARDDITRQGQQIGEAVKKGAAALIVEPVSRSGTVPAVEAAVKAGTPVIILNQMIDDPSKASAFVGVSNEALGALEMERAAADLGGKGALAILLGPLGTEGQVGRSAGYDAVLAAHPGLDAVFEGTGEWFAADGYRLASNWLKTGTAIDAFVSQNDNMALGAMKAVEESGRKGIRIYGIDAIPEALEAVRDGRLTVTVSQEAKKQAGIVIETALKLIDGKNVERLNIVEGVVVDASNVKEYLNE